MNFLKKYWRKIAWFLVWAFIIIFFDHWQERFYLQNDVESIGNKANIVLISIEVIFFSFLLASFFKHSDSTTEFFVSSVNALIFLLFFFLFFHSTFTNIGLFINRQTSGTKTQKAFRVEYSDDDSTKDHPLIYSLKHDHLYYESSLNDFIKTHGKKDTLAVPFSKGFFGVNYITDDMQK